MGLSPKLVSGDLTGVFAFVGTFVGALNGSLVGQASDIGILRGAAMGAIAGAVLAIEVLEAYHAYWRSNPSRSQNTSMVHEIYGDYVTKGSSGDLLKKLPSFVIPGKKKDGYEESSSCTICLQDIVGGEIARNLPLCFHSFHLSCVDKWLAVHGSCPLCRQHVLL